MAIDLPKGWGNTLAIRVFKQALILPVVFLFGISNAWALNWTTPSVVPSAVADGVCLAGPFANSSSANVSVQWTAVNTDASPGRSIALYRWNESTGQSVTTGVNFFNAPVGQLPTQTSTANVNTTDLVGTLVYFALNDTWDTGNVWSSTRSPELSNDLTGPASGNAGYASIDMSADPDCVAMPEINVTGNGFPILDGDGTPSSVDHTYFGSVAHASGTLSRTFTIQNTGTGVLTLGANAATLSGTHASEFAVTSQPATTVGASGSTSVTVEFDPSAVGTRSATLSIASDDGDENPYNFALSGIGVGAPEMNVTGNGQNIADGDTTPQTADHTDFGSIDIGDGDIERTFTVENIGDANLTLGTSSVSITGPDAADFSVFTHPPSIISDGSSNTSRIRFDPSTVGTKSATVTITNDDADESPYSFAISGTGTTAPEIEVRLDNGVEIPNGGSHVGYRVASLSFNEASGTRTYTINNIGSDTLTISGVTFTGTHAAEFDIVTPPAASVAAGGTTSFTARFTQTTSGVRTATVNITNNDADEGTFTFDTSGLRFAGPDLDMTGNGLDIANGDATPRPEDATDFGSVNVTSGAVEHSFTGANNGDSPIVISSITVSGAHASDFSVTTGTGFTPLTVRFDPSAAGLRTATVNIASDALVDNPFTFAIQGTGTTVAPEIDVSSSEGGSVADGGTDAQGSEIAGSTKTVTYTVSNSGTDNLTLGTATSSSPSNVTVNAISAPGSTTVTPGNSTTFTVQYTPTIAGAFSFGLSFTNNDGDENPFDLSVSGTATGAPEIAVSSSEGGSVADGGVDAQGTEVAGVTKSVTYTVDNSAGTDTLSVSNVTTSNLNNVTSATPSTTSLSVAAGASGTFTVNYVPTISGAFSFDLDVVSDDADEGNYDIAVSGIASGTPEISVSSSEGGVISDGGSDAHGNEAAGATKTVTFTVSNSAGTGPLTVSNITTSNLSNVTSATPSTTSLSVAAGATGTFTINYVPTLAGAFSFDLDITSNDSDESNYDVSVSGTGVGAPEINLLAGTTVAIADNPAHDPASTGGTRLDSTVGGASSNLFTIENTGTGLLTLGSNAVTLSGSGAGDFSVSQQPASTVAPGGSTTFRILFSPTVAGVQGPVDVAINNDDADESPYNFRVQGTGREIEIDVTGNGQNIVDDPSHSPSATDHTDFGSADIASGSVTRTFTIQNNGFGFFLTLGADAVTLSGPHAGDFSVLAQPATSVDVGLTTSFQIRFDPSVSGVRGPVDVSIANSDPDEAPFNFRIQGTGTSAPEINVVGNGQNISNGDATADLSDHSDFGSVAIAAGSTDRTYTIQNLGSAALSLGGGAASLSGPHASEFSIVSQPPTSIPASGSAGVTVRFSPTTLGTRSAILTIANDDSDEGPFTFALAGNGTGTPEIAVNSSEGGAVSDGGVDVHGVEMAGSAKSITYTVSNTGTDALTLGTMSTGGGTNVAVNSVSGPVAATVAPGGTTSFTVSYTPLLEGNFSFGLSFTSNDSDESPFDFSVSGSATGTPEIEILGNGVSIADGDATPDTTDHTDFGGAGVSGASVSRSFTIRNIGTGTLTLGASAASLSGADAGDFSVQSQPSATVAPGGSTQVAVLFAPSIVGARTATLTIANDDGDENPYDIALAGEGIVGGTVTIVQTLTGDDTSVGFSSATSELNFSLATVSGTARITRHGVPAGEHSIVAEDKSALGYGVTSIICDDADSSGDTATRTATINLTSGEHVTCEFVSVDARGPTVAMIADFLGARNVLMLANQPGNERRLARLKGSTGVAAGDRLSAFGHNLRSPLPGDFLVDEDRISVSTSLLRLLAFGGEGALSARGRQERGSSPMGLDVWIEGRASRVFADTGDGTFGLLSFGVDQVVAPGVLVGFMGQIDRFKREFETPGSEVDGRGWMAGPYVTLKLDERLYLDVLGTWGRSRNDVRPFGTYTDTFDTDRWLVSSTLTGDFVVDNWEIRPAYTLQWFRERQFAYTDSLGVRIPEQSLSQGDMRFGPHIAYEHRFEDGTSIKPSGGIEGVYVFGAGNTFTPSSYADEVQGFTAKAHGGVLYRGSEGLSLGLTGDYGGIGSSSKSFGLSLRLDVPLN